MPSGDPYLFDIDRMSDQAVQLRRSATAIRELGRRATQILSSVPSNAGVSSVGATEKTSVAADSLLTAADDLRSRAVYIWMAESTGNPAFYAVAMLAAPPTLSRQSLNEAGVGVSLMRGSSLALRLASIHGKQSSFLATEATNLFVNALADPSTDKLVLEKMWSIMNDAEKMQELAVHNSQLAARFKLASQALTGVGSLMQFYVSVRDSSTQTHGGKVLTGGLGVAFTWHPAFAVGDMATGGGVTAAADGWAVGTEEAVLAIYHRDSAQLFGAGTVAWNEENLSGQNGWLMQSYALAGDAASEPIGSALDEAFYPGFPFDGDGSVNWAPSKDTVKGWFS